MSRPASPRAPRDTFLHISVAVFQELEVLKAVASCKDRLPGDLAAYFDTRHQLVLHYLLNIGYSGSAPVSLHV